MLETLHEDMLISLKNKTREKEEIHLAGEGYLEIPAGPLACPQQDGATTQQDLQQGYRDVGIKGKSLCHAAFNCTPWPAIKYGRPSISHFK